MEFDSIDPTSAILLDQFGLGPNDRVAWARSVGPYGSRIQDGCRRWGLRTAEPEEATQDVLLCLDQKFPMFHDAPSRGFPSAGRGAGPDRERP